MKRGMVSLMMACLFGVSSVAAIPNIEAVARNLVQQLAARQFDRVEARFDQKMSRALPQAKLAAVWDGLTGQAGKFHSISAVSRQDHGGFRIVVVTCQFEKAKLDARVVFDAEGKVSGLFFAPAASNTNWTPPSYAKPTSFRKQAITLIDRKWRLPGTLTLPNGAGPFPAVVLVQGSGPEGQDETIGPNKPFKDLAWGLATRGVAVLRYNKRTYQYAREIASHEAGFAVNDETVDDARAAIALLAAQPKVDPNRVFVLGHSLGGTMAPRIAQGDPKVAGLIIMAGATRPLAQIAVDQLKYLSSLRSPITPEESNRIQAAQTAEREIDSPSLKADQRVSFLGVSMPGSYFLNLRSYNPGEVAAKLRIPILIL